MACHEKRTRRVVLQSAAGISLWFAIDSKKCVCDKAVSQQICEKTIPRRMMAGKNQL